MERLKRSVASCLALCIALGVAVTGALMTDGTKVAAHTLTDTAAPKLESANASTIHMFFGVARPIGITLGPDGALWYTNELNGTIGRATTAGAVTTYSAPGLMEPLRITSGSDGALWFTDFEANAVGRITTSGEVTLYTDQISNPSWIVSGSDGALWFYNTGKSAIGRLTTSGELTNYPLPGGVLPPVHIVMREDVHESGTPCVEPGLTVGPDGAIWFSDPVNESIDRIDDQGVITVNRDPRINKPGPITLGRDGMLWFYNCGTEQIGRFNTGPRRVHSLFDLPGGAAPDVDSIIAGPAGGVWVTTGGFGTPLEGTGHIEHFSIGGHVTMYTNANIGTPFGITVGPDAALWFANWGQSSDNFSINRITTKGVVSSVTVGNGVASPSSIVAGPDGAMWFTNQGSDQIGRITPDGATTYFSDPNIDHPDDILLGPDGALWFDNKRRGFSLPGWIGRIDTAGHVTAFLKGSRTDLGLQFMGGMAFGPDGNLWFTGGGSLGNLGRNDIMYRMNLSGELLSSYVDPVYDPGMGAITAGPDGAMWFLNRDDPEIGTIGGVGRVTVDGSFTLYQFSVPEVGASIVSGPDGALWFSGFGSVGRITTQGTLSGVNSDFPPGRRQSGLAVGPDGAFWLGTFNTWPWAFPPFDSNVTRVTTSGNASVYSTPGMFLGYPEWLATGPSGSNTLWFVAQGALGEVNLAVAD